MGGGVGGGDRQWSACECASAQVDRQTGRQTEVSFVRRHSWLCGEGGTARVRVF